MKFVRSSLVGLAGLLTILVVIGLFLPDRAHVERSEVIAAPAGDVYAVVSGFDRFNEWSPWFALDPSAVYTVSNPGQGVGASFTWQSDEPGVGSGSQQIFEVAEDRLVRVKLDFGAQGLGEASYVLEPIDDSRTRVTWSMDTEFGYDLIGRYVGLMLDKLVGADYEKGLANLKVLVESDAAARMNREAQPGNGQEQAEPTGD